MVLSLQYLRPATIALWVCMVAAGALATATAETWERTKCGSPASLPTSAQPDLITKWGEQVAAGAAKGVRPLPEYPRPQMIRDPTSTYTNLNGRWQFELATKSDSANPPFGVELNQTILVPFPLESCLSGAFKWPAYSQYMWCVCKVHPPSLS